VIAGHVKVRCAVVAMSSLDAQVLDQLLNKLEEVGVGHYTSDPTQPPGEEGDSIEPINTSDADGMTVLN